MAVNVTYGGIVISRDHARRELYCERCARPAREADRVMDEAELMRIVVEEGLDAPVLDGTRHRGPDAVILERVGATWKVFVTDERASPHAKTIRLFEHESDAMEHVLLKLRQGKKYDESMAQWRHRREQPGGRRA